MMTGRKGSRHRSEQEECCVSWSSLFMVTGTGGGWQQDLYREPFKKDGLEGWKWAKREVQKNGGRSQTKCQSPNGCQAFCFLPTQSCSTMWLISSTDYTAKNNFTTPLSLFSGLILIILPWAQWWIYLVVSCISNFNKSLSTQIHSFFSWQFMFNLHLLFIWQILFLP